VRERGGVVSKQEPTQRDQTANCPILIGAYSNVILSVGN